MACIWCSEAGPPMSTTGPWPSSSLQQQVQQEKRREVRGTTRSADRSFGPFLPVLNGPPLFHLSRRSLGSMSIVCPYVPVW